MRLLAKHVIGDDRGAAGDGDSGAGLEDADIVILSGGLGPTEDDLTRDAVADAIGCSMSVDTETLGAIEQRFRTMKREMPAINRRQAMVLNGAEILRNDRGTAPGAMADGGRQGDRDVARTTCGIEIDVHARVSAEAG